MGNPFSVEEIVNTVEEAVIRETSKNCRTNFSVAVLLILYRLQIWIIFYKFHDP